MKKKITIVMVLIMILIFSKMEIYSQKTKLVKGGLVFSNGVAILKDSSLVDPVTLNIKSVDPSGNVEVYSGPFLGSLSLTLQEAGLEGIQSVSGSVTTSRNAWTNMLLAATSGTPTPGSIWIEPRDEDSMGINVYNSYLPNKASLVPGALGINIGDSDSNKITFSVPSYTSSSNTYLTMYLNQGGEKNIKIYPTYQESVSAPGSPGDALLYLKNGNLQASGEFIGKQGVSELITEKPVATGGVINSFTGVFGGTITFSDTLQTAINNGIEYGLYAVCAFNLNASPNALTITTVAPTASAQHEVSFRLGTGAATFSIIRDRASPLFPRSSHMITLLANLTGKTVGYVIEKKVTSEFPGVDVGIENPECAFIAFPKITDN